MPDNQKKVLFDFIELNGQLNSIKGLHTSYYQIGFICSVQALPELLDLEQWLSYLWKSNAEMSFDNEQQATDYAQRVIALTNEIQTAYQEAIPLNGLQCHDWLTPDKQLSEQAIQFASGFLAAVEIFNEQWTTVEGDSNSENILQTTILLLTKLAPPDANDPQFLAIVDQLPKYHEILAILPQLLSNLAYSAAQNLVFDE
ncbi:UPF0149 family protein [Psychromonas sp. 14N.309.X.WAT.B.A12]|uniref:UPF0149 family protein n=1 Tax=Psychromonas sp. 14N.309.X.WAT.B.A12 TaxID=2998322 RepID=UPI0025B10CB9|nr:UPF0149 family protein [Psychromonas sp. 14N.309.X.WAT.B.A12]MDN2662011.1 UPF0149 family protein [Psychromonas sp. 14N.309.X.WAT.B.A12]